MKSVVIAMSFLTIALAAPQWSHGAGDEAQTSANGEEPVKEQYEKNMETRLGKLGKELDEMKSKAAEETCRAKVEMDRYLEEAERKRKEASRKFEELRNSSQKKWHEFSSDMDAALDDLQQAYEKAKSRFRE